MKDTAYHSILRITTLTLAIMLVFDSGLLSSTTHEISLDTQHYLANVIGIQASVTPTEINMITAELSQRDRDLTAREQEIEAREISVNLQNEVSSTDYSTFVLSLLLFILLILIVTNYALDYLRAIDRRRIYSNEKSV
jgi:sulfur transfer complex TusBCD TusB component (DsrH family)